MKVDSLQAPASACLNKTITIRLFGVIGSDGCHSFSYFEASTQQLRLDLLVWGKFAPGPACPDVMVYLDREYNFVPMERGTFRITIHQPDGSVMLDSIEVQ